MKTTGLSDTIFIYFVQTNFAAIYKEFTTWKTTAEIRLSPMSMDKVQLYKVYSTIGRYPARHCHIDLSIVYLSLIFGDL